MMKMDELFMRRAMELAKNGLGMVSPNPLVGCVIVNAGKIIGEGWHKMYGGAHAEVNAINAVEDKSLLATSTVYVNLEPCAHYGKTPPCADLLIKHGVKAVAVANRDPNPLVGGKGLARMQENGIAVTTGVMEEEGLLLNKRFFTFIQKRRPYIILKWAQTADGFIARTNYDSKWISGEQSRQLVHKWRTEEEAIMVGTNTARHDNPRLNARDWQGDHPIRLVLDKHLTLEGDLHLFDGSVKTICYNLEQNNTQQHCDYVKVSANQMLHDIMNDLYERDIQSVIVEGGARIHEAFINENLWDEARVFVSPTEFETGVAAIKMAMPYHTEIISNDKLFVYHNKTNKVIWQKN